MYCILWEFRVRPATRRRFLHAYSACGTWAKLFRKAPGYVATELLRDPKNRRRFFTVDLWQSRSAFLKAKRRFAAEYHALDARCERLTTAEKKIGAFTC